MRDLPDLGQRQACETRSRLRPATPTDGSYEFGGPQLSIVPNDFSQSEHSFVRDTVAGPDGDSKITCEVPKTIASNSAIIIFKGFLSLRGHYGNLRQDMADNGFVTATSDRLSPEAGAQAMELIARETGCTTFHLLGYSRGGADATELTEFVEGENIATLTLNASPHLRDHGKLQMFGRGIRFLGDSHSFLPVIGNSLLRNPSSFPGKSISYGRYLFGNLPGHVREGLGDVAVLNIAEKVEALRDAGKVAIAGMYFQNDPFIPKSEAKSFEAAGLFDVFHMHSDAQADHGWPISHPRQFGSEYRTEILAKLDPMYAESSELARAA